MRRALLLLLLAACAHRTPLTRLGLVEFAACNAFTVAHETSAVDFDLYTLRTANGAQVAMAYVGFHPDESRCAAPMRPVYCGASLRCSRCDDLEGRAAYFIEQGRGAMIHFYDVEDAPGLGECLLSGASSARR